MSTFGKCNICGAEATLWRCPEHYRCDDCGAAVHICHRDNGVTCDSCWAKRMDKRVAKFKGNTDSTCHVVCPHCGHVSSDSWEMSEGQHECNDCSRKFEMSKTVEVYYTTTKIKTP